MELLSKFLGPQEALPPRLIDYELLTGEDGKRTVGFGWFAGELAKLPKACLICSQIYLYAWYKCMNFQISWQTLIAPYLTLLFNGAGWAPNFPRLMSNDQLTLALEKAQQIGKGRFACIGDISCDVEVRRSYTVMSLRSLKYYIQGGLEFLPRSSTLSSPFYTTRPDSLPSHLPSLTMMSVDILPTALPLEASEHFSSVLTPYLKSLIRGYRTPGQPHLNGDADLGRAAALERATVASEGKLREPHKWLETPLSVWKDNVAAAKAEPSAVSESGGPRKKVLMLGSGMVAGPAVDEICSWTDVELVVASNALQEAERLTGRHPYAKAVGIDVSDWSKVEELIGESDLVISLLPVPFHPKVAEACIQHRKHLVTASYISPAMKALHERAVSSDVLLLNEIGLDPGIDHCSAISMLSDLRAQNKRVTSFTSFCGGLPAPEDADVPLRYKFSWSPKGVLSAALNGAQFKLWDKNFPDLPISDVLKLEGIANRDSLPYGDTYDLGPLKDVRTLFRGTLRYVPQNQGSSAPRLTSTMTGLLQLSRVHDADGPIQSDRPPRVHDANHRLDVGRGLRRQAMSARLGRRVPRGGRRVRFRSALADCLRAGEDADALVRTLDWFGITPSSASSSSSSTPLKMEKGAAKALPIDVLAALLAHKLRYAPGERDVVVLSHEIVARRPTSSPSREEEEIHTASLVTYGTPAASAMAR
ncbi:hypothetical protein EUX98_g1482, partial [Antrodiella citrinella]